MPTESHRDYLLLRAYQTGITEPRELAIFMGQMETESGNFSQMHENLNYSGRRLLQVFPGRNGMNTLEEADAVAQGGPEAVANTIYGGAWGVERLANTEPGDGWRFHGRGYVQLTGRDNYTRDGRELGLDLVNNPDLAADRDTAAGIALHYWSSRVVPRGHQLDVREATHDINGGYNNLPERRAAADRWERALTPEIMQGLSRGEVLLPPMPGQREVQDDGVLRQGERGPAVRALQENLNRLGVTDAQGRPLVADDHYGRRTREAVQAFQHSSLGLVAADGVAGPDTIKAVQDRVHALNPMHGIEQIGRQFQPPGARADWMQPDQQGVPNYLQARNISRPEPDAMADGVLRPGEHGPAVGELQQNLNTQAIQEGRAPPLTVDNNYGRDTRQAVENYQLWNGLPTTGVADPATLAAVAAPRRTVAASDPNDAADLNQHDELRPRTTATPPTPDPGLPAMANPVQSHGPRDLRDPRDPTHPDHALYEQIRTGVEKLDVQHGRGFDATSERMSLSLLTLAKETGITRVDEVVMNRQTSTLPAGTTVFLVQGDRSNEAMHRESMPTAVATQTPPEKSMQQLEVVNQQIVQQRQEALARGQDDPSRGGPSMGGR